MLIEKVLKKVNADALHVFSDFSSWVCHFKEISSIVYLIQTLTFMNDSGLPTARAAKKYGIEPENIIVAHDELEILPGKYKLKFGGTESGHNGLRSITKELKTRNYGRIRIGIGRPNTPISVSDFVLLRPQAEDRLRIDVVLNNIADNFVDIIKSFCVRKSDGHLE